ncbi:ATP-grasp domain-containing protein [Streptomyces sp. SID8379]|uniref:ATP-grasp domain-containing protein n=1 Tax=unclassified Streptomyces TaxID=2593676 RepID=UPI00036C6600|nr:MULTISPECIES: ATP-grasp domain-containing protein [unclassified Streptomyces]MYW67540.1 ATP-grasp domain-containing protein [Streptomyces sp. SID8379]
MSRVLVLNRYRLQSAAFHRWLDPGHELYLINCATRAVDRHPEAAAIRARYAAIAEFDDYTANPEVVETAREWIRAHDIDTIVAFSEHDVLRAARLRDEFGLQGQSGASAEAYRDKLRMKRLLDAAGLPVVPYAELERPGDIERFAAGAGYPVLAKPRTGTGSQGIERVDDDAQAAAFAAAHPTDLADHLVEAFTPHELLHCDGVFADGKAVFSEVWSWSTTMLEVRDQPVPTLAVTLDADDPRRAELVRLAEQTLRALPTPRATAFHIEFFDTADGIVVNEAASRVGGGRIQPTLRRLHGVDLVELAARHQTRSTPEALIPERAAPTAGFLLVYDSQGARGRAPATCELPGISHYETALPPVTGERPDVASTAYLLSGVALGDSRARTGERLLALHRWFLDGVVDG